MTRPSLFFRPGLLLLLLTLHSCRVGTASASFFFFFDPWFYFFGRPLFPIIQCGLAYVFLGFDILDFDTYAKVFRDDSVAQVAQSGSYQGASNIEEYIRFASAETSAYLTRDQEEQTTRSKILGFNSDTKQCEFLAVNTFDFFFDPTTTKAGTPSFTHLNMVRVYLDYKERYITRLNVYYHHEFLGLLFGDILSSENTRRYLCEDVIGGACSDIVNVTDDCEGNLALLSGVEGPLSYFDGDTQGCRALHSVFAATNPVNHCPHVSFDPMEDPQGRIKCQTSQGVLPSELFTEQDFAEYRDFANSVGIDPDLGHNCAAC